MPLFRVSGIPISVDWTWLIALGYVVVVLVGNFQDLLGPDRQITAFLYGAGVAFAFFGSIVLHELGHAFVARRNGIGILGIDLWLLGGLAKMDREPNSPGVEFRVAAAGPLVTLVIAAALLGAAFGFNSDGSIGVFTYSGNEAWVFALSTLGFVNLFLLVFNLIPAYPLDGGRIARSVIWKVTGDRRRATLSSAALGRVFGWLLMAFGFWLLLRDPIGGALFLFMGFTLAQSARGASIQEGVLGEANALTVADVMDRQPVTMPSDTTVQGALDEYFWRYRWPWFPVVDRTGRFVGLIEQHSVEMVDDDERPRRQAGELIAPDSRTQRAVQDDTPLTALIANQSIRDYGALIAVDREGLLLGVITIEQVQRALRDAIARATRQDPQPPSDL